MPDKYLVAGDHRETLASGCPVSPGDTVSADAVDLERDQHLLAAGVLIDIGSNEDPDLSTLTRGQLNAHAETLGIPNPGDMPNKDAVLSAITDKENHQ